MAAAMDRQRLETIVQALCQQTRGDWLLIGGALVALWLDPRRVTEDVDVMGLGGAPDERYQLMELADSLGLPVEAVNSAADFFVRRIDGWRDQLEVLASGAEATVYRPTPTLFLLLKCRRLSERDLEDCQLLILHARRHGLAIDVSRVIAAIDALPSEGSAELFARRAELRAALASWASSDREAGA